MSVRIDLALYREYVTYSVNGVPMLYARLYKALYGMLRAVLLFYRRLQSTLKIWGLKLTRTTLAWPILW